MLTQTTAPACPDTLQLKPTVAKPVLAVTPGAPQSILLQPVLAHARK